jgi:hypothetical protein
MIMKRINTAFLAAVLIATVAPGCYGQYTTDWVANTYGTNTARVGNVARSMWVAPEGVIYTASMWDENEGYCNLPKWPKHRFDRSARRAARRRHHR